MSVEEFEVHFRPKSDDQQRALELIRTHSICFLTGQAGTGKTHLACAAALCELSAGRAERIYLTRPAVEAGENLGFLPGELESKLEPYLSAAYGCVRRVVEKSDVKKVCQRIEATPLAYLRGSTFHNGIAILDEAQNVTYKQLVLYLSRIGDKSRLIICGDLDQSDLASSHTALGEVINRLRDMKGVAVVELTTNVRHPMINEILNRLR